ncbi:uncharacterized protein LOC123904167 [Trifolium pratense]|nr:uncharacterized protein LOC123904167 [Trifolium pratense]
MNKSAKFISEGGSSHRPPLFEGDDYYYWKDKMELFLRSQDTHMWTVIEVGDYTPLVKDSTTPKTKDEMTTQEADRVLLNTKAQLFIKSALCREEYDRIMECKTAKEMWTTLQTHHEGTSRVKETRIDIGVRKFELFEMKEDESIDQMYGRFTIIINELNSLGKKFSIHERVRKVLRCLPKSWRHIVTAITESKDLTEVKLEDLIGSLKAHESILQEDKPMKNKMIALDSQTKERSKNKEAVEEDNKFLQEDDEEELAFLSRRIQKLMMRRNQIKKNFSPRRNGSKPEVDISKIQCYGCNQFGHYKNECPKQKNSPYKSMMATWDELDEVQEAEEEQEANVCLMTNANIEEECHLAMKKKPWYLDSGCSRHMTGDRQSFLSFDKKEGGTVTFGNNEKASIKGKGTIGKNNSAKIENVHYVEGLKHNLISISQLCDNGLEVIFRSHTCEIKQSDKTLFYGSRIKNVYVIYLDELPTESCFVSLEKDKWIWHKRAGHISMKTMSKLSKLDLVRGLPDISFDLDKVCESCAKGKQVKSSFKPKDFVSTKRPLELLHIDLFGPVKTTSLGGKNYDISYTNTFNDEEEVRNEQSNDENQEPTAQGPPKTWRTVGYHPPEQIIGNTEDGVRTRRALLNKENNLAMISQIEPRSINEAITDESWTEAMKEELLQFEKNEVWNLVPLPQNHSIIGTRWVFRNKLDENGKKSAFLNGFLNEEVYVHQPPGFIDQHKPNHVFKLTKALYGLKQAPRAWYERLSSFLLENGFSRGKIDTTLFKKIDKHDLLIVQVYVDDIIFGATNEKLCEEFSELMQSEFEMSMMGELSFFLGLQIKQHEDGIFISQEKYIKDLLKKYKMNEAKIMSTPMHPSTSLDKDEKGKNVSEKEYRGMIGSLLYLTASRPDIVFSVGLCARFQTSPKESHLTAVKRIFRYLVGTPDVGLWYQKKSHFELRAFCDADYAGDKVERKSTSGACQFLGEALVSWCCRKQNTIALSTTEAEYVSAATCCSQVIWIKNQLEDFSLRYTKIKILCDNTSAINLSKNPIQHSRSKHIEIKHHFIQQADEPSENDPSEEETIQLTQKPNPKTDGTTTPKPTIVVPSQAETPPIIFKSKKAKSYDSSKIRRSSRIMSGIGTGKKPVVDNTVHTIHDSDSDKTISDSELEKIVLEPLTSSKSVPAKHSPVSIKKSSATAVKIPKKKSLPKRKRPQGELLEVPLIHPEEEAKFDQYWKTKPVASGRIYDFEEIAKGGVDLLKFVEPQGWTKFFQMKDTTMPLLVQAFYFNAKVHPDKDLIISNIKGVEIHVTADSISKLLEVKRNGETLYGKDWYAAQNISKDALIVEMFTDEGAHREQPPSSLLKKEFKIFHNMCQHSFFPRTGSKDKVTDNDLLVMYHLSKGIPLD